MYEYSAPLIEANPLGVWGTVAAVGVPAAAAVAYLTERRRRRQQAEQAEREQRQSQAVVIIPSASERAEKTQEMRDATARSQALIASQAAEAEREGECFEAIGFGCGTPQFLDVCRNMASARRPEICVATGAIGDQQRCNEDVGHYCSPAEMFDYCSLQTTAGRSATCRRIVVAGAPASAAQPAMKGLGFTDLPGHPTCDQIRGGEVRCFRTTTVNGQPPEQDFAAEHGCVPIGGERCSTTYGNPGMKWCCPEGCPQLPGAPAPPGACLPLDREYAAPWTATLRHWWFWAGLGGIGAVAYFGYKLWQEGRKETLLLRELRAAEL